MAIINGIIREVGGFTTPAGVIANSAGKRIVSCAVTAQFTGTYAQANGVSLAGVGAAVAAAVRNGRTYTVVGAGFGSPGVDGDVAPSTGHVLVGMGALTVTGGTITGKLLQDDMITEWPDATSVDTSRAPILINVALLESA